MTPFVAGLDIDGSDRFVYKSPPADGEGFFNYLLRAGYSNNHLCRVYVNNHVISRIHINALRLRNDDVIRIVPIIEGDGSDPLAIILTIAVIVTAAYAGAAIASAYGLGAVGTSIVTGTVALAGTLVVSAILGPPDIEAPSAGSESDPIFSISGGANQLLRYEPYPIVLGRHKVFPVYGSLPYTYYDDDDQYLNQVFHFGFGPNLVIGDRKIGLTNIEQYDDVTRSSVTSGEIFDFDENVVPVQGSGNFAVGENIVRRTPDDTTHIQINAEFLFWELRKSKGEYIAGNMMFSFQHKKVGENTWRSFTGHNRVRVNNTEHSEPFRRTWSNLTLPETGEYDIRITFISVLENTEAINEDKHIQKKDFNFSSINCFQSAGGHSYEKEVRDAISIRATSQLSGSIDKYSAIIQNRIPIVEGRGTPGTRWITDDGSWQEGLHNNPAAVFRHLLLGYRYDDNRLIYGEGAPASMLHDASILEWYKFCLREELTFNYVQRTDEPMHKVIDKVCRAGRASKERFGTKIGVIFDDELDTPSELFNAENIVAGSFNTSFITDVTIDEVVVSFVNPDADWDTDEVRIIKPGISNPENSVRVNAIGATNLQQATRFGNLLIGESVHHNVIYSFEVGDIGKLVKRGDVVWLAVPRLDTSGQVQDYKPVTHADVAANTIQIKTDVNTTVEAGQIMTLRTPAGATHDYQIVGKYPSNDDASLWVVLMTTSSSVVDYLDNAEQGNIFYYIYSSNEDRQVRIVQRVPRTENVFKITARPFSQEYYASKTNPAFHTSRVRTEPVTVISHLVDDTWLYNNGVYERSIKILFTPSGNYRQAEVYNLETSKQITSLRGTTQFAFAIPNDYRDVYTVRIVFDLFGSEYLIRINYRENDATPDDIEELEIEDCADCFRLVVRDELPDDFYGFRFRYLITDDDEPAWDDMLPLHDGVITSTPYSSNVYSEGDVKFAAKFVNLAGNESPGVGRASGTFGERTTSHILERRFRELGWPVADGERRIGSRTLPYELATGGFSKNRFGILESTGNNSWALMQMWNRFATWTGVPTRISPANIGRYGFGNVPSSVIGGSARGNFYVTPIATLPNQQASVDLVARYEQTAALVSYKIIRASTAVAQDGTITWGTWQVLDASTRIDGGSRVQAALFITVNSNDEDSLITLNELTLRAFPG